MCLTKELSQIRYLYTPLMGKKNKTVSFRIREDKFGRLKDIADERGLSLSSLFREYVDTFISHDGRVHVAPEHAVASAETGDDFPVKVEVPKSYVREHERLELEAEHLREQLDEYKQYATRLRDQVDEQEAREANVVRLEELDEEIGTTMFLD